MNNRYLETEPLAKLMRRYSVPCVISLLVGALYNIVDQIFIANASYLGSYGNAANTVVFPFTVIALAIAVMIGDGCSTFLSMSLGAGETRKAKRSVGSAVFTTVISAVLLSAVFLLLQEPLITFFGGRVNAQTFALAKEYFFWIVIGFPFYMFGQGLNPVIRADGDPKYAMKATLLGAVTNMILDPLMISVFRWGMTGAAAATVIGQIVTAGMTVRYLMNMNTVSLNAKDIRLHGDVLKEYLPLGITSLLSQISLVASMAAVNSMVQKYSLLDPVFSAETLSQIPMAVIGIVMKFFQIVISVVVGTAAGCAPIAAYNTGAGRNDRVKSLFLLLVKTEAVTGLAAFLLAELAPRQLISLFGAANESIYYTEFAVRTFRIYLSMIIFACVNKGVFIYLQALGRTGLSAGLSMIREIVLGVLLPVALPMIFGLDGILYSMPCADIITFVLTIGACALIMKELSAPAQIPAVAE